MKSILVIGSSNTDMVLRLGELPLAGQTILGSEFQTFGGGKGANQAVAARRAGGDVCFVAAVGNDDFGRNAIASYRAEGINTDKIEMIDGTASGVALIFVSDAGENCIGVAPGANGSLTAAALHANESLFENASVVLVQLEIPMPTVTAAIELAAKHGTRCILNPAPAAPLADSAIKTLFCITPNENEAEALTGIAVVDTDSAKLAANKLLDLGVENVVITLGKNGAILCNAHACYHHPAESVDVVDTTGAGDTFNGVFAAMIANGSSLEDALRIAVEAASLSVQTAGAIDSIPFLNK